MHRQVVGIGTVTHIPAITSMSHSIRRPIGNLHGHATNPSLSARNRRHRFHGYCRTTASDGVRPLPNQPATFVKFHGDDLSGCATFGPVASLHDDPFPVGEHDRGLHGKRQASIKQDSPLEHEGRAIRIEYVKSFRAPTPEPEPTIGGQSWATWILQVSRSPALAPKGGRQSAIRPNEVYKVGLPVDHANASIGVTANPPIRPNGSPGTPAISNSTRPTRRGLRITSSCCDEYLAPRRSTITASQDNP